MENRGIIDSELGVRLRPFNPRYSGSISLKSVLRFFHTLLPENELAEVRQALDERPDSMLAEYIRANDAWCYGRPCNVEAPCLRHSSAISAASGGKHSFFVEGHPLTLLSGPSRHVITRIKT